MALTGVHALLYTSEPEALRAVLRDVFGWSFVDAHDGWLIFALPPAELGVHPGEHASHEMSIMCDDITATVADLRSNGIVFESEPQSMEYGVGATMLLPGDARMLLYEPRHATAI